MSTAPTGKVLSAHPMRDAYLVGKLGAYFVPTLARLDKAIHDLHLSLIVTSAVPQRRFDNTRHDIDALLDRRGLMTEKVPA